MEGSTTVWARPVRARISALNWGDAFPFSGPAVAKIEQLSLRNSVTLLAGENGTGKSTILEAIATAIGFAEQLSNAGFEPIGVEMSELLKGGGSVKCCTLEVYS